MENNLNEIAQGAIHGDFLADVSKVGENFVVSIKHYKHDEDHCRGQNQVVGELHKAIGALNLNKLENITHGGGFACVKCK